MFLFFCLRNVWQGAKCQVLMGRVSVLYTCDFRALPSRLSRTDEVPRCTYGGCGEGIVACRCICVLAAALAAGKQDHVLLVRCLTGLYETKRFFQLGRFFLRIYLDVRRPSRSLLKKKKNDTGSLLLRRPQVMSASVLRAASFFYTWRFYGVAADEKRNKEALKS